MTQSSGRCAQLVVHLQRGVERTRARAAGCEAVDQRERAQNSFHRTGRAQGVAGGAFGGRTRHTLAEHGQHSLAFGAVVGGRGRAVQVDVVDGVSPQRGRAQRSLHGHLRTQTLGVGRGHVVRVAGLARTQQPHRVGGQGWGIGVGALQQRIGRAFADGDAVAACVTRPAGLGRGELERGKTVQRRQAQRIHPAHQRCVDGAQLQLARRSGEHLGAGRTRGGDGGGHAGDAEVFTQQLGQRVRVVRVAVAEGGGQGAGDGIARSVGQLGLQDAGCAGAHEHAHTAGTHTFDGRARARLETVGLQGPQGQPVVAAFVGGQGRGQRVRVHPGDLTHPGGQVHRLEGARLQTTAVLAQGGPVGIKPHTQAGGGGKGGQQQGLHGRTLDMGSGIVSDGLRLAQCGTRHTSITLAKGLRPLMGSASTTKPRHCNSATQSASVRQYRRGRRWPRV